MLLTWTLCAIAEVRRALEGMRRALPRTPRFAGFDDWGVAHPA